MGIRNRKGVLRSILISIIGYGGDALCTLRAVSSAVIAGFRALDPDYARKVRDEMNHRR